GENGDGISRDQPDPARNGSGGSSKTRQHYGEEKKAEREEPEPRKCENERTRASLDREKREGERRSDPARVAGPADEADRDGKRSGDSRALPAPIRSRAR